MTVSFNEIYRLTRKLDKADQERLVDYLINPPPPLSADEILQILHQHSDQLRQHGVVRIGLFGSHARNEAGTASDIDILVELRQPSLTGFTRLKLYLEDILGYPVDLVTIDAIRQEFKPAILNEVIYAQGL
jgi:uncharacterized protein